MSKRSKFAPDGAELPAEGYEAELAKVDATAELVANQSKMDDAVRGMDVFGAVAILPDGSVVTANIGKDGKATAPAPKPKPAPPRWGDVSVRQVPSKS